MKLGSSNLTLIDQSGAHLSGQLPLVHFLHSFRHDPPGYRARGGADGDEPRGRRLTQGVAIDAWTSTFAVGMPSAFAISRFRYSPLGRQELCIWLGAQQPLRFQDIRSQDSILQIGVRGLNRVTFAANDYRLCIRRSDSFRLVIAGDPLRDGVTVRTQALGLTSGKYRVSFHEIGSASKRFLY